MYLGTLLTEAAEQDERVDSNCPQSRQGHLACEQRRDPREQRGLANIRQRYGEAARSSRDAAFCQNGIEHLQEIEVEPG